MRASLQDHNMPMAAHNQASWGKFYWDLVMIHESGTSLEKGFLQREMRLMGQCLSCDNIFQSLEHFLDHKRLYCRKMVSDEQDGASVPSSDPSFHENQRETPGCDGSAVGACRHGDGTQSSRHPARGGRRRKSAIPIKTVASSLEAAAAIAESETDEEEDSSERSLQHPTARCSHRRKCPISRPPLPEPAGCGSEKPGHGASLEDEPASGDSEPLAASLTLVQAPGTVCSRAVPGQCLESSRADEQRSTSPICIEVEDQSLLHPHPPKQSCEPPSTQASIQSASCATLADDFMSMRSCSGSLPASGMEAMDLEPNDTDPGNAKPSSASNILSAAVTGSQTALPKIRASVREKKAPRWMQEHLEDVKGKHLPGSRKRSASTALGFTVGQKSDVPSPPAKQSRLDDAHTHADPVERKILPKQVEEEHLPSSACSENSADRKPLTFHSVLHDDKRTLSYCPLCPKKYRYSWGLKRHLKKTHKLSEEQARACKGLKPRSSSQQQRRRLQAQAGHSSKRKMAAVPGSGATSAASPSSRAAGSSPAADTGTDREPGSAGKRSLSSGGSGPAKMKLDAPAAPDGALPKPTPRITCNTCKRQFSREASFVNHLRMCRRRKGAASSCSKELHSGSAVVGTDATKQPPASEQYCEGVPEKESASDAASCTEPAQLVTGVPVSSQKTEAASRSQMSSSNSGSSKKVGTSKMSQGSFTNKRETGGMNQFVPSGAGRESNTAPTVSSKIQQVKPSVVQQTSSEKLALPSGRKAEKAGEVTETEGSRAPQREQARARPDNKMAASSPRVSTPSSILLDPQRAVVNRRRRVGARPPAIAPNWTRPTSSKDNPQAATATVANSSSLPVAPINNIHLEPGRKQLEIIWVNKLPGQPTEKVRSEQFLVVPDPTKANGCDTKEVDKLVNDKGESGGRVLGCQPQLSHLRRPVVSSSAVQSTACPGPASGASTPQARWLPSDSQRSSRKEGME